MAPPRLAAHIASRYGSVCTLSRRRASCGCAGAFVEPALMRAQASAPLAQNVPVTLTLSGAADFKGFLALKTSASEMGTLSNPSTGTAYGSCGFGHNEPSLKSSVSFTFVPAATATSVTLSGFVVQSFASWYSVSTTLTVAASSPLPPSPPLPNPDANSGWLAVCAPFATSGTYDSTNNASVACTLALQPGDTVEISNCATAVGDTFMRLFAPNGQEAIYNDDGCGLISYGSRFVYSVPCGSNAGGSWRLAQGCFGVNRCSGTTVIRVLANTGCDAPPGQSLSAVTLTLALDTIDVKAFSVGLIASGLAAAGSVNASQVSVVVTDFPVATTFTLVGPGALTSSQSAGIIAAVTAALPSAVQATANVTMGGRRRRLLDVAVPVTVSGLGASITAASAVSSSLMAASTLQSVAGAGGAVSASAALPIVAARVRVTVATYQGANATTPSAASISAALASPIVVSAALASVGMSTSIAVVAAPVITGAGAATSSPPSSPLPASAPSTQPTVSPVAPPASTSSLAGIVGAVVGAGLVGPGTVFSVMACCFKPALRRLLLRYGFKRLADCVAPDVEGDVAQLVVQVHELQQFMAKQKLPRLVDTTPELRPEDVQLDTREPLGCGGYGVVLRGTLLAGKTSVVAVKALFSGDGVAGLGLGAAIVPPDVQKQMRREATIMCSLNHPNVLRILGVVPERGWIVMELCAGGSLKSLLMDPEEQLDLGMQLRFAAETATGVAYLHMSDVAIVHGDLKADNVLLTRDHSCRLSDFGMSEAKDRSKNLTRAGAAGLSGVTVPWTAPEVLAGEDKTYASDVYALGMTLWEIFERGTPYGRVPEGVVIHQVLSGTRPTMTTKTPACVTGLVAASWVQEAAWRLSAAEMACFLARKESEHLHSQ